MRASFPIGCSCKILIHCLCLTDIPYPLWSKSLFSQLCGIKAFLHPLKIPNRTVWREVNKSTLTLPIFPKKEKIKKASCFTMYINMQNFHSYTATLEDPVSTTFFTPPAKKGDRTELLCNSFWLCCKSGRRLETQFNWRCNFKFVSRSNKRFANSSSFNNTGKT